MASGLHIRVISRQGDDGQFDWGVALWGEALGQIITIACCLTEAEARERAELEAAERGLAVRP